MKTTRAPLTRRLLYDEPSIEGAYGNHNWQYQATYRLSDLATVRAIIHVDSYDFQSYARAEVFDSAGNRWNEVATIAGPKLTTKRRFQGGPPTAADFQKDVEMLLDRVELTLGWKG